MRSILFLSSLIITVFLTSCGSTGSLGSVNMSGGPSIEERAASIKAEQKGSHYIGRRYYVEKTRFWGYLRKPREPWSKARLVAFNEDKKKSPDRFPEDGKGRQRYAFDANFEYKLYGRFTGDTIYDPNSNQFLPEFQLTGYEILNEDPGWLFRPSDTYDSKRVTLRP